MVLHVTGGQILGGGVVELGEQVGGHLAQGVDQHVQAATVGHADHHFLHAPGTGGVDQLVHGSDEGFATFEREALLANVLGVQEALQTLGGRQAIQDALFLLGREVRLAADGFELLLPPALLVLVGGIHVLRPDSAAVGLAQRVDELAQRQVFLAEEGVADVEHGLLVSIGETVERRLQLGDGRALGALEGVEIGPALAHVTVGGNQLLHGHALAAHFGIGAGGHHDLGAALLGTFGKGVDDGQVRYVARVAAIHGGHMLQRIKVFAPGIRHATRVG